MFLRSFFNVSSRPSRTNYLYNGSIKVKLLRNEWESKLLHLGIKSNSLAIIPLKTDFVSVIVAIHGMINRSRLVVNDKSFHVC